MWYSSGFHLPFVSGESLSLILMGSMAAVQYAPALRGLRDVWNRMIEERRRSSTDYARVVNDGETRHGWRLVVPKRCMLETSGPGHSHRIVSYGMAEEDDDFEYAMDTSILVISMNPLPDGKKMITLRRYSTLRPADFEHPTLIRFVFDPSELSHEFTIYVTPTSIASVFREQNRFRVIVTHAFTRKPYRTYDIEPPWPECDMHMLYMGGGRRNRGHRPQLCAVFGRWTEQEPEDELAENEATINRFETCVAKYSLDDGNNGDDRGDRVLQPISYESISVVSGDKDISLSLSIFGRMVVLLYAKADAPLVQQHLCVTFDREGGNWNVLPMDEWLRSIEEEYANGSNRRGAWRLLEILRQFRQLDPPESAFKRRIALPAFELCVAVESRPHGAAIYASTKDGIFSYWTRPPSMKYVAAETMSRERSIVGRKRDELRATLGCDVFGEGFGDLSDEDEVPVIRMRMTGVRIQDI